MQAKKILLGVSGGIAAYKSAELCRELIKSNYQVQTVMTHHACQFIQPLTLQILTQKKVGLDLFDPQQELEIGHIQMAQNQDLILLAPATANLIAKIANGICDDLLSTIVLASNAPVLVAPAMNDFMWNNPITQENCEKLRKRGFYFIEPDSGFLACGTHSVGRLSEIPKILAQVNSLLTTEKPFEGKKFLITGGGTKEYIDDFRYISNPSSGKMGVALAEQAFLLGAEVTYIHASALKPKFATIECISATSVEEMAKQVFLKSNQADCVLMAAAISDFQVTNRIKGKIKKNQQLEVQFEPATDILAELGKQKKDGLKLVGFAAESENLENYMKSKFEKKNLDLIVGNRINSKETGFQSDFNEGIIWNGKEEKQIQKTTKSEFALKILWEVNNLWK